MITDLTSGKPSKILLGFSLPMLASAMFQQLYNICDSIVAGKFCGEDALAAIGASYPITMIFMSFALGCNVGASVIISKLFGAKKYSDMKTAVTTSYISFGILSVVLMLIGLVFSPMMLRLLSTPTNVFDDGNTYLRIYSCGMLFVFMYNVCNGTYTALGDSKTPLYFLIGSSVGNVALDLLFAAVLKTGVGGLALATIISQGIACVISFLIINKRLRSFETPEKPKLFSGIMLRNISSLAVPSILQNSFVSVGNLFIQSIINGFGSSAIAGYSAAIKLNTFAITSFTTLGNGLSNFTAQNMGAEKYDRIPQGFRSGAIINICIAIPFSLLYSFFGRQMIGLFLDTADSESALAAGMGFLSIVSPFYFSVCLKLAADGLQRGAGKMKYFMISTFSDLLIRVVLAYALSVPFSLNGVWMSWPVGWIISTIIALYFYCSGKWKSKTE